MCAQRLATIVGLTRSVHVSAILADSHWLKTRERVKFKLAVITYRCLHGTPLPTFTIMPHLADIYARRLPDHQATRWTARQTTVGDRVSATAAPHVWNCLPASVKAAQSLTAFRHQLKAHFFRKFFP
jgi:hypothetical protein